MACSGAAVAASAEAAGRSEERGGDGLGCSTVSKEAECGSVAAGYYTARRDPATVVGADGDAATITVAGTRAGYC